MEDLPPIVSTIELDRIDFNRNRGRQRWTRSHRISTKSWQILRDQKRKGGREWQFLERFSIRFSFHRVSTSNPPLNLITLVVDVEDLPLTTFLLGLSWVRDSITSMFALDIMWGNTFCLSCNLFNYVSFCPENWNFSVFVNIHEFAHVT